MNLMHVLATAALLAGTIPALALPAAAQDDATPQGARVTPADGQKVRYGIGMAPPRGGEEFLEVLMVSPGLVAEEAGVQVGDRILTVNGTAVSALAREEFMAAMRGSPLTLVIDREGETLTFVLALDGTPPSVTGGGERPAPLPGQDYSDAARGLATLLEERYLFPDTGTRYADMLREQADDGQYASMTAATFAAEVTSQLARVSEDRHLRVLPPDTELPGGAGTTEGPESFGIAESGWLVDGVAYLRITGMPDVPGGREWTAQFMREHAEARALVLDLRRCPGGSVEMMNGILAYLFDEPTHLLNMDMRPGADTETEQWLDGIPELRRVETDGGVLRWEHWIEPSETPKPDMPVYVLTGFTGSACEHLTAALRATDRATIIGATTGGAGHFVSFHEFDDGFTVILPIGRTYDPRTGEGWEGVGITPDVVIDAEEAEAEALRRAADGR